MTSELQEAIMLTRMQPIGNVFNKFHRVVREQEIDKLQSPEVIIERLLLRGIGRQLGAYP